MDASLGKADLLRGLSKEDVTKFAGVATPHETLRAGEYLFLLGDAADRLFLVVEGKMDLCFPLALGGVTKDISIELAGPGDTLGWSALVKPHRFTLSARAAEPTRLVSFTRQEMRGFFDAEPRIGYVILTRISELVGVRLLKVQALWARELQRALVSETARRAE